MEKKTIEKTLKNLESRIMKLESIHQETYIIATEEEIKKEPVYLCLNKYGCILKELKDDIFICNAGVGCCCSHNKKKVD